MIGPTTSFLRLRWLAALLLSLLWVTIGVPATLAERAGPALFVVTVGGRDGFIGRDGKIVIGATFEKAYPFRDGLAAVQVGGKWGFIDTAGRMVIEPRFVMVGFFSEGLAPFRAKRFTDPWGYVDKTGEVLIPPQFDCAEDFRNGVARVGTQTCKSKLLGLIADVGMECDYRFVDRTGKVLPEPPPTHYATGEAGERLLFTKDGLVGYLDGKGEVAIAPQFEAGGAFSDGLACVRKGELYGYVDGSGAWVIPPRFAYSGDFSEGLAGVPLGKEGWGFIDRTGEVVIPARFAWVYQGFRHGIAEVAFDGKLGYIDRKGEWVWQPSE